MPKTFGVLLPNVTTRYILHIDEVDMGTSDFQTTVQLHLIKLAYAQANNIARYKSRCTRTSRQIVAQK